MAYKVNLILLSVLFPIVISCSRKVSKEKESVKSDLENKRINGKVQSITTVSYDELYGVSKSTMYYNIDGFKIRVEDLEWKYNEDNQLLSHNYYLRLGHYGDQRDTLVVDTYVYEQGLISSSVEYSVHGLTRNLYKVVSSYKEGKLLKKLWVHSDGSVEIVYKCEYSDDMKREKYYRSGLENLDKEHDGDIIYDDSGERKKVTKYYMDGSKVVSEYEEGLKIEYVKYDEMEHEVKRSKYEHENGELIRKEVYKEGELVEEVKYQLDQHGNTVFRGTWEEGVQVDDQITEYWGNGNLKKIKERKYENGEAFVVRVNEFDVQGNIVLYSGNPKSPFYSTTHTKYVYDERKNWIEKEEYNPDKVPEYITTKREITYYD